MELQPVNPKGHQSWVFFGRTDVEAETPILWPPNVKNWLIGKYPGDGKDWRQEEKGMTEDEMVGWHHWLSGQEFEQAPGDSVGQGSLTCCSPWVTVSQTWLSNWTATNFITCFKCTTLGEVVANGEWHSCFGTVGIWEISVASQFYCGLNCSKNKDLSRVVFLPSFLPSFLPFFPIFWPCCTACDILVPSQGPNLYPLHWKCEVLTTGPLGKSLAYKNLACKYQTSLCKEL